MKKIKLIAAALSLTILSGCANDSSASSENKARIVWQYGNADERGELFPDNMGRLYFRDFETMNSALLCSKPNCTHANDDECSAFGMSNHPILYGDKLYFFDVETDFVDDEVVDTTTVYKAEPDGTNRVKVSEIEGLNFRIFTRALIVGDKAYFSMNKVGWNEDMTASSGYDQMWFCTFDFSTEKLERVEMVYEGWCSTTWIYGLYDGKVIFSYDYSEERVPVLEDPSEIGKYITSVYKAYDIETKTLTDLTLPVPTYVGDGYYIYEKDGGEVVLSENGKELFLSDFSGSTIENGMLFGRETCADLSNGKMYKLNSPDDLVAYSDGYYILKRFDGVNQSYEYSKIPEKDYIGDAL